MSSSPALPSPAASSASAASSNPFGAIATNSIGASGGIPGMFLNLLSMNSLSVSPETNDAATSTTQFGKSGFSFEPTLLVLPQGIANLSEADLQSLLANASIKPDGSFGNQVLVSLTPGTPAAQAIADFLAKLGQQSSVTTLPVAASATELTTTGEGATGQGNLLLIATNLSPSDMEHLKSLLSEQGLTDAMTDIADGLDGVDASEATAVALVMFVPPSVQNQLVPVPTGDESNIISFAAAGSVDGSDSVEMMAGYKDTKSGKYISPFASSSESSDAFSDSPSSSSPSPSAQTGFQGSLAAQSDEKSSSHIKMDIAGKLDASGSLLQSWGLPATPLSDTSSLLTSNGAAITSAQTSPLGNPLISNPSAASVHPASHAVSVMIEKSMSGSEKSRQTLSMELDPPELGRVQIQLSYEKGEPMKVHLLAEKQDTLNILQRDSHALKAALEQAGIQTDGSSLSFDLAGGDQSFNQMLGQSNDGNGQNQTASFSLGDDGTATSNGMTEIIETRLDFVADSVTGNVHYSLLV